MFFLFVCSSPLYLCFDIYIIHVVYFNVYRRGVEGVHGSADGALPGPEGNADRHEVCHAHQGEHRLRDTPGRGDEAVPQIYTRSSIYFAGKRVFLFLLLLLLLLWVLLMVVVLLDVAVRVVRFSSSLLLLLPASLSFADVVAVSLF